MNENESTIAQWDQLKGDGGTQVCSPTQLTNLKNEFQQLCKDAGFGVNDRRQIADDVRFCRWTGQSPDGRKHDNALLGKAAFPFDGSSDKRERTADAIANEQVTILMSALLRANIGFRGVKGEDDPLGDALSLLWEWVLSDQVGPEWLMEWTKFAQWRQSDSPAVGIMQIYWHQERALRPEHVTAEDVMQKALAAAQTMQMQVTPEAQADLQDLMTNPARTVELAGLIGGLWDELTPGRAKKVAEQLQTQGDASFPYPYICENRLKVKARRMFDDIFIPENTPTDFNKRARVIYVREWFTRAELEEREAMGDFQPEFLAKVLEHEGETGWQHLTRWDAQTGEYAEMPARRDWNKDRQRGHYELITAIFKASNTEGIPGIYSVVYHANVEIPGSKLELIDYKIPGGKYFFVGSSRELLTDRLWDSRGISELAMTEQNALKQLHDSFLDHAQLSTVPPIKVPRSRPKLALVIKPMVLIKEDRPGEIAWMQPPAYPQTNENTRKDIREGLARYFGQMSDTNPPDLIRLYMEHLVNFFLVAVGEAVSMGMRLCAQYLDDETIAAVVGEDQVALVRSIDAEDAVFRCELDFEAGMLSLDFMEKVGTMITNFVLPWDTQSTVQRDVLVRWFLTAISKTLKSRLVRPVTEANQSEADDEENNFTKIAAGIEPPMMEEGQNWALRKQTLLGIGQKNPEAYKKLTPASLQILEARLKHLGGMEEQQKNAQIGRTMAAPALPGAAEPAAAGAAA